MAVIGLVIGAFGVVRRIRPTFKSPIPESARKFVEQRISKSYASPVASFALGLVATFTLLPCTRGPYLVGLSLISGLGELIEAHLLLTLYSAIFAAPLIAILTGLLAFSGMSRRVKVLRSTELGVMERVSGSPIVVACIWILRSWNDE